MTPARLRECLAALHWPQRVLARQVGCDEGTVRAWARGDRPVPEHVALWIDKLARWHECWPLKGKA